MTEKAPKWIMCRVDYDGTHDGQWIAVAPYPYEPPIEYSGNEPQYVRADIHQALTAERDALAAEVERLREYYEAREAVAAVGLFYATDTMLRRERDARAALEKGKGG